jgi:hypothetical protein
VGLSGLCGRRLYQRGLGYWGLGQRGLGEHGLLQANAGCDRLGLAEQLAPIDGRTHAQR